MYPENIPGKLNLNLLGRKFTIFYLVENGL